MKKAQRVISFLAAFLLFTTGCSAEMPISSTPTAPSVSTTISNPTTDPPTVPTTVPITTPSAPTTPSAAEPQPEKTYVLSFAGDCTFGDNYTDDEKTFGTFCKVVKENYKYPLSNVKDIFQNDDYSLVNLECALTDSDPTEEEMKELEDHRFRFRGPKEYAKILVEGGVEFGSCANNHSQDYGKQGLYDTWEALEAENVDYASFGKNCIVTTKSGLTLGIFAIFFNTTKAYIESQVKALTSRGAEIVIMSIHWGDEGVYTPHEYQIALGHDAIDAGVDIVFGHHSHTLLPIENYNGGVIYYSLGNFSFGGNRNPADKDTAILQQQICRWEDGSVTLGNLTVIPCRVSTSDDWNDFRPTPYKEDHPGYLRAISKLEGSFEDYVVKEPEPTTPAPQ